MRSRHGAWRVHHSAGGDAVHVEHPTCYSARVDTMRDGAYRIPLASLEQTLLVTPELQPLDKSAGEDASNWPAILL
jgi:hypothetical protein